MRIGVIGLGAIGGVVAARLLSRPEPDETVDCVVGSARTVEAIRAQGLRVQAGSGAALVVPCERVSLELPGGAYDLLLLCVRSEDTAAALRPAASKLAPDGALVCLQNGLPEEAAARFVGRERTLGAVIGWSASLNGPGALRVTGGGRFTLGALDPHLAPARSASALVRAEAVLVRAFPVRRTTNLAGARWSKLAFNCALSTLGAVSGLTLGGLAARRTARSLALQVITEAVEVAHASGISLEPVAGLHPEWVWNRSRLPAAARHALVWLGARRRPQQRSGMLAQLEAGKPAGQVDDLNGAVVRAAAEQGLAAPLNSRLVDLVHAIEQGRERLGPHQLERLAGLAGQGS